MELLSAYTSLIIATALLLGSPGPVPITLAALGSSVGFKRGTLFLSGIIIGLFLVVCLCLIGLFALAQSIPQVLSVAFWMSNGYLLFLAVKVSRLNSETPLSESQIPGFKSGVIFNLINPKAYAAVIALLTLSSIKSDETSLLLVFALIVVLTGLLVDSLWLYFGSLLHRLFASSANRKFIQYGFAMSLMILVAANIVSSKYVFHVVNH